jgi:hypothetical protein
MRKETISFTIDQERLAMVDELAAQLDRDRSSTLRQVIDAGVPVLFAQSGPQRGARGCGDPAGDRQRRDRAVRDAGGGCGRTSEGDGAWVGSADVQRAVGAVARALGDIGGSSNG